jgi:hypothetical protein
VDRTKCSDAMAGAGTAKNTRFDFTKFVKILFRVLKDLREQQIRAAAYQFLSVVRCSSDRLVLAASNERNGYRVSRIKQEDDHVFNVLTNISQCTKLPSSIAERSQGN